VKIPARSLLEQDPSRNLQAVQSDTHARLSKLPGARLALPTSRAAVGALATSGNLLPPVPREDGDTQGDRDHDMSLCRRRIVAFLLESRLYSLSERNDREILSAASERDARWRSSGEDRFYEIRKAAGSVFC